MACSGVIVQRPAGRTSLLYNSSFDSVGVHGARPQQLEAGADSMTPQLCAAILIFLATGSQSSAASPSGS
jgi:hypothetical protein